MVRVLIRHTAVDDREVGEVCPAGIKQDGRVSLQTVWNSVSAGVLQGGGRSESGHSHRDTVTLQTSTQVRVYKQTQQHHVFNVLPLVYFIKGWDSI